MLTHREKAEHLPVDKEVIRTSLLHFFDAGDVFEIRALDVEKTGRMYAGLVNKIDYIAGNVAHLASRGGAKGVYFTPQQLSPKVLERGKQNFLPRVDKGDDGQPRVPLAHDEDVTARRYFIVDVDPVKAKAFRRYSATDAEKEAGTCLAPPLVPSAVEQ